MPIGIPGKWNSKTIQTIFCKGFLLFCFADVCQVRTIQLTLTSSKTSNFLLKQPLNSYYNTVFIYSFPEYCFVLLNNIFQAQNVLYSVNNTENALAVRSLKNHNPSLHIPLGNYQAWSWIPLPLLSCYQRDSVINVYPVDGKCFISCWSRQGIMTLTLG